MTTSCPTFSLSASCGTIPACAVLTVAFCLPSTVILSGRHLLPHTKCAPPTALPASTATRCPSLSENGALKSRTSKAPWISSASTYLCPLRPALSPVTAADNSPDRLRIVQRYLAPRSPKQQSAFRAHMQRYLDCYLPNSGIEFALTMRYKQSPNAPLRSRRHKAIAHLQALEAGASSPVENGNETLSNGTSHIHHRMHLPPLLGSDPESPGLLLSKADLCVLATHEFKPGEILRACRGGIADLSKDEDEQLRGDAAQQRSIKHNNAFTSGAPTRSNAPRTSGHSRAHGLLGAGRDFSVIRSARKGCSQLFLGPARFVNHDCEPNVEFYRVGNQMAFRCIRPIRINEEIVTYYGDNYFDVGNAECLCATCEARQQGAFTPDCGEPAYSQSGDSPEEESDAFRHESIAERASRRHSAAAAQATIPPSALAQYVDLQEVKYAPENSDTKDGHITRKMLDEPEALMESAGGGNTGRERECVTCRAHFWSKESWWTQEECSRCERHYKIFKADWPGRIPTEGLIARYKGKKPLQRLEQIKASQADRKAIIDSRNSVSSQPDAPCRAKASFAHQSHVSRSDQSGSDTGATSRDGTPVVLTPLRATENPGYAPDHEPPPTKRRRMGSHRPQAAETSPATAPSGSRTHAPCSRTPTPHTTSASSTVSSTGSTTSATTAHCHRRSSTPDSIHRNGAAATDDNAAHERVSRQRSAKARRSNHGQLRSNPLVATMTQAQASTSAIPLSSIDRVNESDDSDLPWEASDSGISDEENSSRPRKPAARITASKGRTSAASAVFQHQSKPTSALLARRSRVDDVDSDNSLSAGSTSDSSEAHLGPKMLGKQATTDALAAHWGATEDTGRFRRRTAQHPQPPQALFTYATGPTYRLDTSAESPGPSRTRARRSHPPNHRRTPSTASVSACTGRHRRTVSAATSERDTSLTRRRSNGDLEIKHEDDSEPLREPLICPSRPRKKLRISDSHDSDGGSPVPEALSTNPQVPDADVRSAEAAVKLKQEPDIADFSKQQVSTAPAHTSSEVPSDADVDCRAALDDDQDGHQDRRGRRSRSTAVDAANPEIETKGSGRTSFNNLSLAWTAGMGEKRSRRAARSEPVLLASSQPVPRQRKPQPRSSHSLSRSMSKERQTRSPVPVPRDTPGTPKVGAASLHPSALSETARPSANAKVQHIASPASLLPSAEPVARVKQEDVSESLPPLVPRSTSRLASPPLAMSLLGGPASPSPAPSAGSGPNAPLEAGAGPTKIRRNLRWGGKKASFTRPLPIQAPSVPAHPVGAPHPDLSCPPDLQARLSTLVERQERRLASPGRDSGSSDPPEDQEDMLLPDTSIHEPIITAQPLATNDPFFATA